MDVESVVVGFVVAVSLGVVSEVVRFPSGAVCLVAAVLSVVDICHVISILADVGAAIEFILVGVAAGSELAGLFLCAESDNLNDNIRLFTFRC